MSFYSSKLVGQLKWHNKYQQLRRIRVEKTVKAIAVKEGLDNSAIAETVFSVVDDTNDVDENNNGLIEIYDLDMLDSMRHNLTGTGYHAGSGASPDSTGVPTMLSHPIVKEEPPRPIFFGYEQKLRKTSSGRGSLVFTQTEDGGASLLNPENFKPRFF